MFVCYVLTETRKLKIKLIRSDTHETFKFKGKEYYIRPDKIYVKKFFGIKQFMFSVYRMGFPEPIDLIHYQKEVAEVPLDEIAIILRKLRQTPLEQIAKYLSIGTFFLVLYMLLQSGGFA